MRFTHILTGALAFAVASVSAVPLPAGHKADGLLARDTELHELLLRDLDPMTKHFCKTSEKSLGCLMGGGGFMSRLPH
ncbi:hypothetical protein EIP91_003571 [Steccherinum ochraceum]|uniref:Uncharacterized protein n=1 Tax=Steccherinum ochraceum TaxID=92696 RepID=A0A4R0RQY3_9APHY|nr:hypothetical protein EIP91_003571 [Steccherinum ochraceum]